MKKFSDIIKPTMVLAIVTLIVSSALVLTYNLTHKEDGKANGVSEAIMTAASEVLGSEAIVVESEPTDNIKFVFKDSENKAMAFYVVTKGYGGEIHMVVGVAKDGTIKNAKVTQQTETPDLGSLIETREFIGQFIGKSQTVEVVKNGAKETNQVDALAGATISSKAFTLGINTALSAFEKMKGELS
ncbi:MAG: electron transporter RnfG [Oscillospiraceae bacterium]|jgi:electron transport complex protein RnfG|nr:electron transporter RnfG [Oscillospiraceae bacterium]